MILANSGAKNVSTAPCTVSKSQRQSPILSERHNGGVDVVFWQTLTCDNIANKKEDRNNFIFSIELLLWIRFYFTFLFLFLVSFEQ